ncbi:hypothetical protein [Streptomyces huiliensis]|uniref:hypothetical protein n=1 Tax=Streptomyces huiliensis TaxID=2876027 RepID=UPI001CC11238|nr:hypothetical protein [Streptomyces huiliensis]MBZ4324273.1 hypothetical protein [Streptomyces huiliensis]
MRVRVGPAAATTTLAALLATTAAAGPAQAAGHGEGAGRAAADTFFTRGDYVHFSGTAPGRINAHGWWTKNSGPATMAKVTIWLQGGTGWRTLDKGVKTVPPGGGSNKRAVANWGCTNFVAKNDFRSVVDVDIVGYPDGASKLVTKTQTLYCGI